MVSRAQLYKYKGNRCSACGISIEEMVERYDTFNRMFEFHHIDPKTKHKNYSNLIKKTIHSEQIAEIDKCALLCKKCHGIVHAQNNKVTLQASIQIKDRTVTQKLNGWTITDKKDKTITFITNEKLLLTPCLIRYGNKEEQLCLIEIDHIYLENVLKNISSHKLLEVYSLFNNKLLVRVESVKDKIVNLTQALGAPFFSLDFEVEEGDASYIWVRNGVMLTKEGMVKTDHYFTLDGMELTI